MIRELKISAGAEGGAFTYFVGQTRIVGRRWCVWVFICLDNWQTTPT